MGIMDGTMAKGDDMDMDADRMQMLTQKMNDGTISDDEREELSKMQDKESDSSL